LRWRAVAAARKRRDNESVARPSSVSQPGAGLGRTAGTGDDHVPARSTKLPNHTSFWQLKALSFLFSSKHMKAERDYGDANKKFWEELMTHFPSNSSIRMARLASYNYTIYRSAAVHDFYQNRFRTS
jgi:hypothetical protein